MIFYKLVEVKQIGQFFIEGYLWKLYLQYVNLSSR
jgi:hypothetical protein